jgi:integrase
LRGRVLTRKVEPFLRLPPRSRVADTRLRFHSPDLCGAVQQLYADFIREALHPDQTSAHKNHRATSKLIARLPDDPDVADLSAWVSALRNAYARSTADLHRQNLGAVLQWGNDTGRCYGHPLRALRFRREAPKTAVIWKFAEVWPRVLGLFDPETEQRERLFLAVCCYLAPRKGEALALRRDSFFQRRNGKWWVTFAEQREAGTGIGGELNQLKTRKARTLPVPPDLVNILLPVLSLPAAKIWVGVGGQRELESPYLLPFRGHEISAIRQRLRALPEFAANGNAFHMLRRSRAVQLRQQGKTPRRSSACWATSASRTPAPISLRWSGCRSLRMSSRSSKVPALPLHLSSARFHSSPAFRALHLSARRRVSILAARGSRLPFNPAPTKRNRHDDATQCWGL